MRQVSGQLYNLARDVLGQSYTEFRALTSIGVRSVEFFAANRNSGAR